MMTGMVASTFLSRSQEPSPKKAGSGSQRTFGSPPAQDKRQAEAAVNIYLCDVWLRHCACNSASADNQHSTTIHSPCIANATHNTTSAATHITVQQIFVALIGAAPASVFGTAGKQGRVPGENEMATWRQPTGQKLKPVILPLKLSQSLR
jgi:hypothetical protein